MKKLFMLLALALGVASCQNEPEGLDVVVGGEQDVNITVSLPESTRGTSSTGFDFTNFETNSTYDLRYILEIKHNDVTVKTVETSNTTSMVFPVRLAPNREYTFTVWADLVLEGTNTDLHYNTANGLDEITFNNWTPNTEARDAYTKTMTKTFTAGTDLTMELTRPFAKVRVVATDIKDVRKFGIEPDNATVSYAAGMYESFNAVTGEAGAATTTTKAINYNIVKTAYDDVTGQLTVFTDYILVPTSGTVQFSLDVKQGTNTIKNNIFNTAIPVEKNKVTSIVGSVLTEGGNVNITVDSVLGEKETFTYISSGAELLKVIKDQDSGKYILGCDIDVDENDVALAGALSATRSTTTETVINLNGYTITINNKSNESLVTLADGYTLVFAGEGEIVMDADSTAPFVENKNTNGVVIIEQATLTNNSTNATIVDGTAVVNEGVEIEGNIASGETTSQLDYVLANGGEVTLLQDVTSDKILEISATNPVVINGNGKTISFTSNRGFRVTASNNVTIENATIVNNVDYGRCIETRTGNINLTLNNVTLTATQTGSQPFTVGGSGIDVTVNINNSTINAGKGYGITTFNPTALTINNSTVTGYAALYIKAASGSEGSAGSVINVTGSTLAGVNNWPGVSNAFSTIMLEDSDVTINIDSTSTVKASATDNTQIAICLGNELVDTPIGNCDITIAGTVVLEGEDALYALCSTKQGSTGTNVVKFNAKYAEELQTEGWIVSEPTDSLVTITSAVAELNGNIYATLEAAVAAAEAGDTITLTNNVTLSETVVIESGKTVVLDLNGKTLSAVDKNVVRNDGGNLTIKNGTVTRTGDVVGYSVNNASGEITIENATIARGLYTSGSKMTANNANISHEQSSRHAIYAWNCEVAINSGTFHNDNAGNATLMAAGSSVVTINGGEFSIADGRATLGWTSCLIDQKDTAQVIVKGGQFNGGFRINSADTALTIEGGEFNTNNGSGYTYNNGAVSIKGGTYTDDAAKAFAEKYVAEGYGVITKDNTYIVIPSVLKDGDVLDLGGAEYAGTITVEGNVTIKGDTKIKTLKSTTGCTITIEDGKTLTLNNFSFGVKDNASAKYEIKGGTVTANYGFFQHGIYTLRSNFETGYMYYSFGSDITVYGTFHSQGKGDGLDYVRGKLTIAKGGKSIHDRSLWVGQPASWGVMNASLVIEDGGYVQANSLSVYEGSTLTYSNDADLKYNSVTGKEYITKK